ncbi:hypothetical protein NKK52_30605 [Mesorhizobium sp. C277A]|uniref:hypothetical protein n=1 Tax=Mesorhizobium sp. C277A TaxID=2956827 RepID=UPI0012ECA5C7|nr:hypothetical protein [Mesorhizobium sp. LSJC277A00]
MRTLPPAGICLAGNPKKGSGVEQHVCADGRLAERRMEMEVGAAIGPAYSEKNPLRPAHPQRRERDKEARSGAVELRTEAQEGSTPRVYSNPRRADRRHPGSYILSPSRPGD